ncbi:hypothetical protein NDA16_000011 [Ustilago loliicola]|nr:hypothetical protein NDA16_000011 [Ustilago loliicola]
MLRTVFTVVSHLDISDGQGQAPAVQFCGGREVFAVQRLYTSSDASSIDLDCREGPASATILHEAVSTWTRQVAHDHAETSFASGPLWAVKALKVNGQKYAALCMHHALYDGPSIDVIFDRVRAEYVALGRLSGSDTTSAASLQPLASLVDQCIYAYASTAEEQRESLRHWEQQLQGRGPAAMLPDLTVAKPLSEDSRGSSKTSQSPRFVAASRVFHSVAARKIGTGVSTLIKTAFAIILSQYVETEEQRHVALGEILSLRNQHASLSAESGAVGPLLTTLPFSLLVDAGMERKPAEAVWSQPRTHGHAVLLSLKHRFAPLAALAKIMGAQAAEEMFTAMFVYHPARRQGGGTM